MTKLIDVYVSNKKGKDTAIKEDIKKWLPKVKQKVFTARSVSMYE